MAVFFTSRDRERLIAVDNRVTKIETSHNELANNVNDHNKRCEKWQFWAITGYFALSLVIIGFLLDITVFHKI